MYGQPFFFSNVEIDRINRTRIETMYPLFFCLLCLFEYFLQAGYQYELDAVKP